MALQGTISGINQIYFGGQTALTAIFTDTETGQTPAGLQYAWDASQGRFIGATDGASVTYHADFTGGTDQTVEITCEVTLPGNPNPTVSAPSLTAMTELGITGQLMNMLIDVQINDAELFNDTNTGVLDAGSDAELTSTLIIHRIRWNDSNQLILNRSGGGSFRDYWTATQRQNYSAYIIIHDGTVLELPGDWIPTTIGIGYVRWEVPSTETTIINALDAIATGHQILLGFADADSIGIPDVTASADATVNVRYNAPPNVTITAPQKVNPGDSVPISVSAVDPEGRTVTVLWSATGGTIDNPTSLTPNFTAPPTSGPVTLTCTARDADSVEGSNTHVIVVNSPPAVTITAPSQLEVDQDGNISIAVSDPNSDPVTVLLETSAGSIDTPTALSAVLTAPATPQTITLTVTATDSDRLATVETAQITIIANQPPTLSITVPNALEIGQTGDLRATVGDPTNDRVTIRWDATAGTIGNRTALNTTITVPATPQTITVTCTATDDRGATTTQTATITVRQPNRPPTVSLNVAATASPGQTVNIEAVVDDLDGDDTEGEWRSPKGSIAQPDSKSTTFTAPLETGIVPLTYEAMDDMGATTSKTAYITIGDPKANIYTPAYQIEIQGVDVTSRWIKRDGMTVGKSLDYPELLNFRSSGVQFNLDNADGAFDYSNPNNFFLGQSLPTHGRGAQVLVSLGRSRSELAPVFAGEISAVVTSLRNTKARIKVRDLSVVLRQSDVQNFGQLITRPITSYEGANADYDPLNPVFYFPIWGLPISRGSVTLTVHKSDGTAISINIVETIATEGILSNKNAEIDYNRGLIRFEAPPDDGIDTVIVATWKKDYQYRRPDALIRELLVNAKLHTKLSLTPENAAFAISPALVRHPTDRVFSSNGRPYFEKEGIVRWMKIDDSDPNRIKRYLAHENKLLEYDEKLDKYTEISSVPEDTTAEGVPPGGYGTAAPSQNLSQVGTGPFAFYNDRIYAFTSLTLNAYNLDGTTHQTAILQISAPSLGTSRLISHSIADMDIADNNLFVLRKYTYRLSGGNQRRDTVQVLRYDFPVAASDALPVATFNISSGFFTNNTNNMAANSDTVVVFSYFGAQFQIRSYDGTVNSSFEVDGVGRFDVDGLAIHNNSIFALIGDEVRVFSFAGVEQTDFAFNTVEGRYLQVYQNYLYTRYNQIFYAYDIEQSLNYHRFGIFQFDTIDFNNFYVLATNSSSGDAFVNPSANRVRISKYVRSTNTWTQILDADTGQPQLGTPYDFLNLTRIFADNRKNFRAIRRSNKTLIFYRRSRATQSGIAMYNETDDTVTDIFTQTHTSSAHKGLPYSMDFWLDERSDGIYVYSFVVEYTLNSDSTFASATLKIHRRRVQPIAASTQVFSETFTATSAEDLYPVSVSDVMLDSDNSRWYFNLEYQSELTTTQGKSELCTVPQDGGSRTVIKTYPSPFLSARSPVKMGSRYFYLEGQWLRLPKSDPTDDELPDDERYYPNEAGQLIEIQSNNDITDHGIVWRSASKLDSPDPEAGYYDGWGLHNAVVSNMIVDTRDNLHFVAGYGIPYRIINDLPVISQEGAIPDATNFVWMQWGQDLATKIPSFPTTDKRSWDLIQQLVEVMGWEVGFGPGMGKVQALQAAQPSISDWSANASFFFRPRTILPAKLRTAISASGSLTTIELNDSGLPAEVSEFPVPPAGAQYPVIIDREMFSYTGVNPDAQGRTLTGVQRAQYGSTVAAHSVDAGVYFVDYFASGERGTTLVSIQSRAPDFVNLRNDINIGYGATTHKTKNQRSIDANGEFTFNLQQRLLSKQDKPWAEIIGATYLKELSNLKEVLQFTLVFSPRLQSGQLVVVYQLDRVRIDFKLFRLVQVQPHTHPRWQTQVTALEIIPEGVPPRWLTVPRQLLMFNQNLNLDLNSYLAGTLPIQAQASGLPGGFSINNGVISGSSNTAGEHTITLTAVNNDGEDTTSFEILIGQPRWPSIPVQNITETDYFVFDFSGYTPEGLAPITYALGGSAPSWVSRSGDYILGQPPNETGDQTYIIPIVATNEIGASTVNIIVRVEDTI